MVLRVRFKVEPCVLYLWISIVTFGICLIHGGLLSITTTRCIYLTYKPGYACPMPMRRCDRHHTPRGSVTGKGHAPQRTMHPNVHCPHSFFSWTFGRPSCPSRVYQELERARHLQYLCCARNWVFRLNPRGDVGECFRKWTPFPLPMYVQKQNTPAGRKTEGNTRRVEIRPVLKGFCADT